MKKRLVISLIVALFATCSHQMSAYSRTKRPESQTTVVLGSAGIGAATWVVTKFLFSNPAWVGTMVGSHGINVGIGTMLNPLSGKWPTIAASVVACAATWVGWNALSSYTASGYFEGAQKILSGEKCSEPEVLELVKMGAGDSEMTAHSVIDYFSARKNELAKSVNALESLFNQLSLANYYLEVAQRGFDEIQADLAEGFRENIAGLIVVIKNTSMLIKAREGYERQYQDELKESEIGAQYATARAIRSSADSPRIHYTIN